MASDKVMTTKTVRTSLAVYASNRPLLEIRETAGGVIDFAALEVVPLACRQRSLFRLCRSG
jgi:hypothetical protein